MISLTKSKVPDFLRNSELYSSLYHNEDDVEEKDVITIPSMYCKMDEIISSHADAIHLCHTLRYWGVSQKSTALMEAAFGELRIDWNLITNEFGSELMFLQDLTRIRQLEPHKCIEAAIRVGCLALVKVMQNSGCRVVGYVNILAGECGHLDILEYFYRQGFLLNIEYTSVIEVAAKGGHLRCIQYAHEHGCPWHDSTCSSAVSGGHLDCLKYAHEHGCPWDNHTTKNAAFHGHLNCLEYAHENGCTWHDHTCSSAALEGHLDYLKYAHEHGCPWYFCTTAYAAESGFILCLRYAHEHGCPWHDDTCSSAAAGGHLDCLKYAHEHGCLWGDGTTQYAALYGHLECLRFAHEHGCPWDNRTTQNAAAQGHLECLQYALENGCS